MDTHGLLHALCTLLIDVGVVSEQRLLAEAHRQSFAAARRTHPCDWNTSLLFVFQSSDVASKIASGFRDRKDCVGLLTASSAFASSVTEVTSAMPRPKVLIWGDSPVQDVDIFDPVSTSWHTFPTEQEWRYEAQLTVINGRFYVCGGRSANGRASANLACFDPSLGIWQTLPPMSQARASPAAAVLGARLYVCGGQNSRALNSAECFDTRSSTWSSLPNMRRARAAAEVAVIRGYVYVVGGGLEGPDSSSERLPPTGNWQTLPEMNVGQVSFSTAVVADKLYACGGHFEASMERFDPDVGFWELLQPMFRQRPGAAVAVLHGQLYVCGGYNHLHNPTSCVERFDPGHNTWQRLAPMRYAREDASAVVIDGRLLIVGVGTHDEDDELHEEDGLEFMCSAEWFDPRTERWQHLQCFPGIQNRPHLAVIPC